MKPSDLKQGRVVSASDWQSLKTPSVCTHLFSCSPQGLNLNSISDSCFTGGFLSHATPSMDNNNNNNNSDGLILSFS